MRFSTNLNLKRMTFSVFRIRCIDFRFAFALCIYWIIFSLMDVCKFVFFLEYCVFDGWQPSCLRSPLRTGGTIHPMLFFNLTSDFDVYWCVNFSIFLCEKLLDLCIRNNELFDIQCKASLWENKQGMQLAMLVVVISQFFSLMSN